MTRYVLFSLLASILIVDPTAAQDWKASPVPDSLAKGAGMVKREELTEIDILSPKKARIHERHIYTILDSQGDGYSTVASIYDKFHDLSAASGAMYDKEGKVIKKFKKGDMEDMPVGGNGIFATDSRAKVYRFTHPGSYPYTIMYEIETDMDGLFVLPRWAPQAGSGVAIEDCKLVVRTPTDYDMRYKEYHLPGNVVVTNEKGTKTYTWELKDHPAYSNEPYTAWAEKMPNINLAPSVFELAGFKGSLVTWKDMGHFVGTLFQGRDQLPDDAKRKVHRLTDTIKDDREKISVLYRYMQKNTHYVGIELGVGGWQPYDAAYVYTNAYGDCKALANYMVALLKEAGIRSNPVLIRAGESAAPIDTSFACSQFNHVIVVAFAGNDSIWLECTSSVLPAGYLSGFTSDRDALLLASDGGHIVHTPIYGVKENQVFRFVKGSVDSNGVLQVLLDNTFTGMTQDALQNDIDYLSKKELLEKRRVAIGIPGCTITNLNEEQTKGPVPVIRETMNVFADHWVRVSEQRIFIDPGIFLRRESTVSDESKPRVNEFEISSSMQETDSIVIQMPPGYMPDGNLPHASLNAPFGSYSLKSTWDGMILTLVCHFRQNKGTYPPDNWSRLVRIKTAARREAASTLIFVKKA